VTGGVEVKIGIGASCASEDTSGSEADLTTLSTAISDLASFETALTATTPTQTLEAISVPANGSMTITDTVVGPNIVSVPSVTLKKGATLQLAGGLATA
jgi:hypothetical protein